MTSPEGLGLSKKDAEEAMKRLHDEYGKVVDRLTLLRSGPKVDPQEIGTLEEKRILLIQQMDGVREWYELRVQESLESVTKQLRDLTLGLVGFTIVLAVLTVLLIWRTF
jgi:hypothetical protein